MPIKIERNVITEPPKSKVYDVVSEAVQGIKKDIPELSIPGTQVVFPPENPRPAPEDSPQEGPDSGLPQ